MRQRESKIFCQRIGNRIPPRNNGDEQESRMRDPDLHEQASDGCAPDRMLHVNDHGIQAPRKMSIHAIRAEGDKGDPTAIAPRW